MSDYAQFGVLLQQKSKSWKIITRSFKPYRNSSLGKARSRESRPLCRRFVTFPSKYVKKEKRRRKTSNRYVEIKRIVPTRCEYSSSAGLKIFRIISKAIPVIKNVEYTTYYLSPSTYHLASRRNNERPVSKGKPVGSEILR